MQGCFELVKIILGVEGMMCGMCEAHMNDAVRNHFKVTKVSSSHKNNSVEIISESDISRDELEKVVEQTGYKLTSYDSEPYEKKKGFLFFQ